ncbi:MAG: GHKL domain-containing protein [Bacteroidia bacterium]|nr:GHKL domain-containing protein [Bacteroidia bacterium]
MSLKKLLQNRFIVLLLSILCFVTGFFLSFTDDINHADTLREFEVTLHRKEAILKAEVDSLSALSENISYQELFRSFGRGAELFGKEGIVLLIYQNDTLKFWSHNSAAVENYRKEVCLDDRIAQLRNGWFEVYRKNSSPRGAMQVVGLLLLKREYHYQNKYLQNTFQSDFRLPEGTQVIRGDENNANKVYSSIESETPKYLCTLLFPPMVTGDNFHLHWLLLVLYLVGMVCVVAYLQLECSELSFRIGKYWSGLVFVLLLVALRWATIYFQFPGLIYSLPLFSAEFYGDAESFWLPSLGDFFLNALLIFYICYFLNKYYPARKLLFTRNHLQLQIFLGIALLIFYFVSRWLNNLFIGLIFNSIIPFNINNIFELNIYSYIAFAIPGLMLFAFYFVADKLLSVILRSGVPILRLIWPFSISTVIYVIYSHWVGTLDEILFLWPGALLLVIFYSKYKLGGGLSFSGVALVMLIFGFYSSHVFLRFSRLKEYGNRKNYVEKLAVEQDPLAEHFFNELTEKIRRDTSLTWGLHDPAAFRKTMMERYFAGYWDKYDIRLSVFDTLCYPVIDDGAPNRDNHAWLEDQIATHSESTECPDLRFVNNPKGKISYLSRLPLYIHSNERDKFGDLYIELESRFISEEIGFPELLLEKEIGLTQKLADYSYAKYKNGVMINSFGKYPYGFYFDRSDIEEGVKHFEEEGGHHHLYFRPDTTTLIVLSKKPAGTMGFVTTFSYLFTYYSIVLVIILLLRQMVIGFNFSELSFKYRIQLLLVFTVLVSLVLFGAGTIYYIKLQYEEQNIETISEKTQSVMIEVENKLGSEKQLSPHYSEYSTYILKKFANVFFTDITLYDLNGNMYASSRPKVFEEGLASRKMDPEAYYYMAGLHRNNYIHEENIGNLKYLSSYVPFRNKEGKLLAYLNLPYFAKQSELEKEISTFLAALINIYVFLFAFSVITALLMSNYLTKPLRIIQDKLRMIRLGTRNEPIIWKQKDEIGSLVSEYNRMILELQKSAELLARSERESAWREMAKQVAHEIKNPLTPMKLSIQHLQRLLNDNSPDIKQKIQRLSQTLIEQIETLSNIAGEFSNFAKMPKPRAEKLELSSLLRNTVSLFKNSTEMNVQFDCDLKEAWVNADKDQLVRVFNNLIKNGMQAIPEGREGKIKVSLLRAGNFFLVKVEDNGSGISAEVLDKIFVPNFTTKSTGMGLGLAMVKNIIESMEGTITFVTKPGEGTVFSVSVPVWEG